MQYKEFGIRLTFRPTIAGDVIRLKLRPEVSTLDFNNGVILSGFRIPALNTRRAETDVELRDGQSFAIAGLMNNISQTDRQAIPILSKLPIIGNLFKSKAERAEQTELMVLITPRLVRALDPDEVPLLPTRPEDFIDPTGDEKKTKPPGMEDGPEGQGTTPRPAPVAARRRQASAAGPLAIREPPRRMNMRSRAARAGSERGAVLVQVAIALVGLIALSAFVIDYGVLWVSRRQAQNSADAAAMAGAISMGFVDMDNQALARESAIERGGDQNRIWGAPPIITAGDVTFPAVPGRARPAPAATPASASMSSATRPARNPLPTFFAGTRRRQPARASAPPPPPRCCSAIPPTASSRSPLPTSGSSSVTT